MIVNKLTNYGNGEMLLSCLDYSLSIYIRQYKLCKENFSEQNVHDFRVCIRRFMALLSLLDILINSEIIQSIKSELKSHLKSFSFLRDVQTQIIRVMVLVHTFPILYKYYHYLIHKEEELVMGKIEFTENFYLDTIIKNIKQLEKHLRENSRLKKLEEGELVGIAYNKFNNVILRYESITDREPAGIHKVRLAFKKFRYTMEILRPITQMTEEVFYEMKAFQTVMGKIQDNVVFLNRLKEYIDLFDNVLHEEYNPLINYLLQERRLLINEFFIKSNNIKSFWKAEYLK
jgi:CHAD domain-containing protein